MSKETREWLAENVLKGFTDVSGYAWHYQDGDDNHYPLGVPMDEVKRRLFGFDQEAESLYVKRGNKYVKVDGHVAVTDPSDDTGTVLGVHGQDYQVHTFKSVLLDPVEAVIGNDDVQIGSAGLLKNRKVGWLQIERPDNVVLDSGVSFRPHILLSTSLDGSYSTQINNSATNTVCDNTMEIARGEGLKYRVKHTANSLSSLGDMATVIAQLVATQDAFTEEVEALLAESVNPQRFGKFIEAYVPILDEDTKVSKTRAEKKRETLTALWKTDIRVQPWAGTAWGVVQAVNTYAQHMSQLRGVPRVEKNMLMAIEGKWGDVDGRTLMTLAGV